LRRASQPGMLVTCLHKRKGREREKGKSFERGEDPEPAFRGGTCERPSLHRNNKERKRDILSGSEKWEWDGKKVLRFFGGSGCPGMAVVSPKEIKWEVSRGEQTLEKKRGVQRHFAFLCRVTLKTQRGGKFREGKKCEKTTTKSQRSGRLRPGGRSGDTIQGKRHEAGKCTK